MTGHAMRSLAAIAAALFLAAATTHAASAGDGGEAGWSLLAGRAGEAGDAAATADGGIVVRRVLSPGEAFRYGRELRWDGTGGLKLSLRTDRVNRTSEDYREGKARFTAFVTVAFGEESERLGWRTRVVDFFSHIFDGFPPGGIRLTYAIGNSVPVGSMYRLHEEETVFVVAGEDQAGKDVAVERDVLADFRAAYGREAKGRIDRILAGAARPAREDGPASVSVAVTLPKGGG